MGVLARGLGVSENVETTKIDEVRNLLRVARLLSLTGPTTSLADDILEKIEMRNDEVLTEEALLAVLGGVGFPLDKA